MRKGITEGISRPGTGHQILPKELVDEVIIISDMYDLNEYMALDLLCTGNVVIIYLISLGIAHRLWYIARAYLNWAGSLTKKYLNVSFEYCISQTIICTFFMVELSCTIGLLLVVQKCISIALYVTEVSAFAGAIMVVITRIILGGRETKLHGSLSSMQ